MRAKVVRGGVLGALLLLVGCLQPTQGPVVLPVESERGGSTSYTLQAQGGVKGKPSDRPKPKPTKTPTPSPTATPTVEPTPTSTPTLAPCAEPTLAPITQTFSSTGFGVPSSSLDDVKACQTIHLVNENPTRDAVVALYPGSSLDNPLNRNIVAGPYPIPASGSYDLGISAPGDYYLEVYYVDAPSNRFNTDVTVTE